MADTREFVCEYYLYEGGCTKGREGTFWKACQTCNKYKAKKNTLAARKNLKRQKIEKIRQQEMDEMTKEY